jgi:hypothetical protein
VVVKDQPRFHGHLGGAVMAPLHSCRWSDDGDGPTQAVPIKDQHVCIAEAMAG